MGLFHVRRGRLPQQGLSKVVFLILCREYPVDLGTWVLIHLLPTSVSVGSRQKGKKSWGVGEWGKQREIK